MTAFDLLRPLAVLTVRLPPIADKHCQAYPYLMDGVQVTSRLIGLGIAWLAVAVSTATFAAEPPGPANALEQLSREGKFNGAVVLRSSKGVIFARGFGLADPFASRGFTPDTVVDSGSLAKPVTAAAILKLVQEGKLDLDAAVQQYLPEYPYEQGTVRQLLAHSAGLPVEQMVGPLGRKTNALLLTEISARKLPPLFPAGSTFVYCNLCYTTLALLIERSSGKPYLQFVREKLALPASVTIRPARLADWKGRAIGYRIDESGKLERADSYEDELFYGSANFSISAAQLARWGTEWWKPTLAPIQRAATTPAIISGKASGLTLGNWYCATGGRRCHYLGHHEGFHHMLYWDRDRRLSLAMVTNNSVPPGLQQRLQRALVAFAEKRNSDAQRELSSLLPDAPVEPGAYQLPTGERVEIVAKANRVALQRGGINYLAFPIGKGIRYVPGIDIYVAGAPGGALHLLGLYEDMVGQPVSRGS